MIDINDISDKQWKDILKPSFQSKNFLNLQGFLNAEHRVKKTIFPQKQDIFNALNQTAFENVAVIILGQDPYHGAGQAHGLSFSVPRGVKIPPSLRNIYKELYASFGKTLPDHGDLSGWAKQGVLLLNATLTVEEGMAASHQNKGWEELTDDIIQNLNDKKNNLVFMLWGSYAQKKAAFVDEGKHLVLKSVHPSPLSAHRGFIGCGHFIKANEYLRHHGKKQIEWF